MLLKDNPATGDPILDDMSRLMGWRLTLVGAGKPRLVKGDDDEPIVLSVDATEEEALEYAEEGARLVARGIDTNGKTIVVRPIEEEGEEEEEGEPVIVEDARDAAIRDLAQANAAMAQQVGGILQGAAEFIRAAAGIELDGGAAADGDDPALKRLDMFMSRFMPPQGVNAKPKGEASADVD